MTYDEWVGELFRHGRHLVEYADKVNSVEGPTLEVLTRAQNALRWCADHLDQLWD